MKEKEKCGEMPLFVMGGYCVMPSSMFLCLKKKMRRNVVMAMALMASVSCGLQEIGGDESGKDDVWLGPGVGISQGNAESVRKTVWYLTGVDYPEGYDWRADAEVGTVKCSLVVYANGVPMMKVPAGDAYETSSAPDMHRVIDGDLYTDYSSDSTTVIKKNGKLLFRYPGREMMVGMAVDGDDVYTLGQSRSGRGFSYRKNGELLFEHPSGSLFDHFEKSASGCSFAYSEEISLSERIVERYYIYSEDSVRQIAVREDVKKVWDVIITDGDVQYLASLVGISNPVSVSGDDSMTALEVSQGSSVRSCRFVHGMPDVVEGVVRQSTGVMTSYIWRSSAVDTMFPLGLMVSSMCSWDDGICCTLTRQKEGAGMISRCGELFQVPVGYSVMGASPIAVVDGILHVGLTSSIEGRPAVWKDGEVHPLDFNGFISTITAD